MENWQLLLEGRLMHSSESKSPNFVVTLID